MNITARRFNRRGRTLRAVAMATVLGVVSTQVALAACGGVCPSAPAGVFEASARIGSNAPEPMAPEDHCHHAGDAAPTDGAGSEPSPTSQPAAPGEPETCRHRADAWFELGVRWSVLDLAGPRLLPAALAAYPFLPRAIERLNWERPAFDLRLIPTRPRPPLALRI